MFIFGFPVFHIAEEHLQDKLFLLLLMLFLYWCTVIWLFETISLHLRPKEIHLLCHAFVSSLSNIHLPSSGIFSTAIVSVYDLYAIQILVFALSGLLILTAAPRALWLFGRFCL